MGGDASHRDIHVFVVNPRTADVGRQWRETSDTIYWADRYGCAGVLIFAGNDTHIEPWVIAQFILERTTHLSPLIAVNPIYMHPFAAAKMIASYSRVYNRRVWLNMITGTALSHLAALGDTLSHDERYARLLEYVLMIQALMRGRPVSTAGTYYTAANLQLFPPVPAEHHPEFLLAGQSPAARDVCARTGAVGTQMLPAALADGVGAERGIHFGLITRPTEEDAWRAARQLFPSDPEGQALLKRSMSNTDSSWKMRMNFEANRPDTNPSGYWLEPFRNFMADCPYVVASHDRAATLIADLMRKGVDVFILDVPPVEHEYQNLQEAFRLARARTIADAETSADAPAHVPANVSCTTHTA